MGVDSYNDVDDIYDNDDVWDDCISGNGGNTCVSHMIMTRIEQLAKKNLLKKIAPTEFILKRKVPLWKVTNQNLQHHCGLALPLTANFFQKKNF